MQSFVLLGLVGYFIAYLSPRALAAPRPRKLKIHLLAEFSKGVAVALLARYLVGSPMAVTLSGIALYVGEARCSYRHRAARNALAPALGALLVASPLLFSLTVATGLPLLALSGRRRRAVAATGAALALPVYAFYLQEPDVYMVYSLFLSASIMYHSSSALAGFLSRRWRRWHRPIRRAGVVTLLALSLLFFYLNRYVYHGFGMQLDTFRHGPIGYPVVALTFDDGPDPRYTPAILDILKEKGVTATFFVVGRHVERYPDLARRIVAEGHEIANHTYSHRNLFKAGQEIIEREIARAEKAILEVTGQRPRYFRPPRGLYDSNVMRIMQERGYTMVLFSLSSFDWLEVSHRDIAGRIVSRIRGGDVILFHDSGDLIGPDGGDRLNTVKALPEVIDGLKARGYRFVTIRDLMILSGLAGSKN